MFLSLVFIFMMLGILKLKADWVINIYILIYISERETSTIVVIIVKSLLVESILYYCIEDRQFLKQLFNLNSKQVKLVNHDDAELTGII